MNSVHELLKNLPSIDALLQEPAVVRWLAIYDRSFITNLLRKSVDKMRQELQVINLSSTETKYLNSRILEIAESSLESFFDSKLKRIVNGTGVILHTNLGRAPLAPEVRQKLDDLAENYCSVEFNLEMGKRGERTSIVEHLITELSGAESAAVVNNNAAAVLLALNSIAELIHEDANRAEEMTLKVSQFLRNTMNEKAMVPFHEELKNTIAYVEPE